MQSPRTLIGCLLATLLTSPALGQPGDMTLFATCAGRLSALTEFQWLLSDAASSQTASQRSDMVSLLEAVALPEQNIAAMSLRIEAKVALQALLHQAAFSPNPDNAAWALQRAQTLVSECTALIQ